jgi:ferredoxin-NADP reductase
VKLESPNTISVIVSGRNLHDLRVESGQFFRWRFLRRDLWWSANPYSLSAPPTNTQLRITAKIVGDHSAALQSLEPGTRIVAEGPYGALTRAHRRRRGVLLLAGGVGVTPLRALFETLSAHGGDVVMIYRAGDPHDVLFHHELEELSNRYRARVMYSIGPRGGRNDVLAGDRLTRILPDLRKRDVFVCGPPGMMKAATETLRSAGVARKRIHQEDFDMAGT